MISALAQNLLEQPTRFSQLMSLELLSPFRHQVIAQRSATSFGESANLVFRK
jgi:hypothetical protein